MKKVLHMLDEHFEEWLTVAFTIVFSILAIIQVVVRFTPLTLQWTEEGARFAFILSVFIAVPWVTRSLSHLQVDMLPITIRKKSEKGFRIHKIIMAVIMAVFSALVAYFGLIVCIRQYNLGQTMNGLPIHMWVLYGVVPLGFALNVLRNIQNIIDDVKALRKEGGK